MSKQNMKRLPVVELTDDEARGIVEQARTLSLDDDRIEVCDTGLIEWADAVYNSLLFTASIDHASHDVAKGRKAVSLAVPHIEFEGYGEGYVEFGIEADDGGEIESVEAGTHLYG